MRKYLGNPDTLLAPTANGDTRKTCMQTCDSTDFSISKSAALYPHSQTFQLRKDFCYVMKKILKICFNSARKQRLETAFENPDFCRFVQEAHQRHCVWKSLKKSHFIKFSWIWISIFLRFLQNQEKLANQEKRNSTFW